ncbi:MAG: chorismate-binding protein [Pyrinomonadaceae bacterium]|nr:chorismate-binding protein [Phycisphaerales bacterium]
MPSPSKQEFIEAIHAARAGGDRSLLVVPLSVRLLDDQLTPVLAYRRLVAPDQRTAPSFLLESVEGGERQGRHSILGSQPAIEVIARGNAVRVVDHRAETRWNPAARPMSNMAVTESLEADPLEIPRRLSGGWRLLVVPTPGERTPALPGCVIGGWFGYAAYDSVRYAEPEKLQASRAPCDDRGLPELQFAYYDGVVVFDHVEKLVYVICLLDVPPDSSVEELGRIHDVGVQALERRVVELQVHSKPLVSGRMERPTVRESATLESNITRENYAKMVARALEYIRAGDVFQVVLGQRFQKRSSADPFDVYRALRAVNPSPYMVYMQAEGCILVASSPEILCRVRKAPAKGASVGAGESNQRQENRPRFIVTNRPLAGTRPRGSTAAQDTALELELLADPKERAEHIMLVDLGRNDVGQVARPGTIELPALMQIERYSHVMHISSTVTGELREGVDSWDALRSALPVGTISGAPKVRAMQIIDELEPVRRGPYGGGIGYVGLDGDMDIALALRTIVVPTALRETARSFEDGAERSTWMYHLQASGGVVADSDTEAEYQETVNKAAALARAIAIAERAFDPGR